jgi:transcriptional regulator of acetoin/glycerol metabolism
MASRAAQATVPSRQTTSAQRERCAPAIRWVFPTSRGSLSSLAGDRILLGRGEDCEVQLPGDEISRKHAVIERGGAVQTIRDLDSRNGVFVNGQQVREAPLSSGVLLRLGEWIGVVVEAPANVAEPEPVFDVLARGLAGGPVLRPILDQVRRAAPSTLPMVLLGETGTGKEGFARAIHAWSGRTGPFVAVNCAALVPSLAEAELFGYRRGAFTGAERSSPGHFRAAQGGTLLLDEITDLPESVQAKLLRALEQREVMPLGESTAVPVDVRIVAATQTALGQVVAERRFRPDLSARLDGMTVRLPPLRDRRQEIAFLFSHLLREHSGGRPPQLEPRLVEQLCLYDWPFNVREMDLLVRRLLVLHGTEETLRRSHLPDHIRHQPGGFPGSHRTTPVAIPTTPAPVAVEVRESPRARRERELAALLIALRAHAGNVAHAAAAVGISRQRAYRLMEVNATGGDDGPPSESTPGPDEAA